MTSSAIIFKNSALCDQAGALTLAPAHTDLTLPIEFALCERDTRKHREQGYILTAVGAPSGASTVVAALIEQLFKTHDSGKGWEVRCTPTAVLHNSVPVGAIYDYQHWVEYQETTPGLGQELGKLIGRDLRGQHILQVCAMPQKVIAPSVTRIVSVPTPGVVDAQRRPRREITSGTTN